MIILGETFALATAILWAFGSLLFSYAARRVGAFTVNAVRIPLAGTILILLVLVLQGQLLQADTSSSQYGWLIFSAFLGLVIGDGCHFKAMVILGPRIASLLAASSPIFAVAISWLVLDQELRLQHFAGIIITLAGISWVTLERNTTTFGEQPGGSKRWGYLLAIIGAMGQSFGLVAAKLGMQENLTPLSAAMIRMMSAAIMIWIVAGFAGRATSTVRGLQDKKARLAMLSAAFIGPVFGIWMSLLSIKYTQVGIASTLMSTTPLWIIPLVMIVHHERPSFRAVLGTVVALAGVALLLLT